MIDGLSWLDERFYLIRKEQDAMPSIDWILERAESAVYQ